MKNKTPIQSFNGVQVSINLGVEAKLNFAAKSTSRSDYFIYDKISKKITDLKNNRSKNN